MNRRRIAILIVSVAVVGPFAGLTWLKTRLTAARSRRLGVGAVFPVLPGLGDGKAAPAPLDRRRVVTFAKTGCIHCDRTVTALRRLAVDAQLDFDLVVVVAGTTAVTQGGQGVLHSIADGDASLSKRFGVIHVPLVFLLGRDSRIQQVTTGERSEEAWRSFLDTGGDGR